MINVSILGSGTGSNFSAILDYAKAGNLPNVNIVSVISDVESAKILDKAKTAGLNSYYIAANNFKTKLEGEPEQNYIKILKENKTDYIVLAGFMRILKPALLSEFPNRIINVHPALLPAFPGIRSWEQALNYGAKITGCTVHFVDAGMDTGPIIAQVSVPVLENDTAESLHARIQIEEHKLLPNTLRLISENRVKITEKRVIIS